MISLLYAQPLVRAPGDSAEYSDLNAMLLGLVIESVAKTTLDRFAATEVFNPLGMEQTRFRATARLKRRTAPSGIWRGKPVPGDVNDQNAAAFGGVAGHAGVFSTGMDLARFAQVWLRDGMGPKGPGYSPATMRQFLTRGAEERHPAPGLGLTRAEWGGAEHLRDAHQPVGLRTHRVHRHRAVDRPDPRSVPGVPHQPGLRSQDSGLAQGTQGDPHRDCPTPPSGWCPMPARQELVVRC